MSRASRAASGWRSGRSRSGNAAAQRAAPPRLATGNPAPCRNRRGWRPAHLRDCRRTVQGSDRGRGCRPWPSAAPDRAPRPSRSALPTECAGAAPAGARPASSGSRRRKQHGRCARVDRARAARRSDRPPDAVRSADLRRRSASGGTADRSGRPYRAGAICRRRRETRAISSHRAPAPAPTGCVRGQGWEPAGRDSRRRMPR